MIIGTGIDLIELERLKEVLGRHPAFYQRILTPAEQKEWQQLSETRQIEYLAGRFAVKEALAKALGTGVGKEFGWQDVSILSSATGAPQAFWKEPKPNIHTHISISHSREYACAQAILEEC